MHRIDADAHVGNLFSEGNPGIGQPGTEVDADWLNAVQEELCNALTDAGVTLVKGDNTQLAALLGFLRKRRVTMVVHVGATGTLSGASQGVPPNGVLTINAYESCFRLHSRFRVAAMRLSVTNGPTGGNVHVVVSKRANVGATVVEMISGSIVAGAGPQMVDIAGTAVYAEATDFMSVELAGLAYPGLTNQALGLTIVLELEQG
jgi:hypothetical protein